MSRRLGRYSHALGLAADDVTAVSPGNGGQYNNTKKTGSQRFQ